MWNSNNNNRQSNDYSFSAGSSQNFRNNNADSYDFDISGDDYSYSSPEQKPRQSVQRSSSFNPRGSSSSNTGYGTSARRSSIEDRAKEILEKARSSAAPKPAADDSDSGPSLQATFAELLEGIDLPKERKDSLTMDFDLTSPKVSTAPDSRGMVGSKRSAETPVDSSYGDSFELSAADLEVGAFAAKRMREKSAERGRRMSFDQPNFKEQKELQTFAKKSAASPDPAKSRKSMGDFQLSTALSSIQRSKSFNVDADNRGDFAKYGSIERSDDEIYKMLNVTGAQDSVASRSFLASSANSSFVDRQSQRSSLQPPHSNAQPANNQTKTNGNNNYYNSNNNQSSFMSGSNNKNNSTNDSYSESENFADDFESREELLASPLPAQAFKNQQLLQQKQQQSAGKQLDEDGEEEEEGYYDDDFEPDGHNNSSFIQNPPVSTNNTALINPQPFASAQNPAIIPANIARSSSASPLPANTKPALPSDNLNSVDEIMQRWYNADSNTLMRSLDDIGRSRSHSLDTFSNNVNNNTSNAKNNSKNNATVNADENGVAAVRSQTASPLTSAPSAFSLTTNIDPLVTNSIASKNTSNNNLNSLTNDGNVTDGATRSSPLTTSNINSNNNNFNSSEPAQSQQTQQLPGGIALQSSLLDIPTWDEEDMRKLQEEYNNNQQNTNDENKNDDNNSNQYSDNDYEPEDVIEKDGQTEKKDNERNTEELVSGNNYNNNYNIYANDSNNDTYSRGRRTNSGTDVTDTGSQRSNKSDTSNNINNRTDSNRRDTFSTTDSDHDKVEPLYNKNKNNRSNSNRKINRNSHDNLRYLDETDDVEDEEEDDEEDLRRLRSRSRSKSPSVRQTHANHQQRASRALTTVNSASNVVPKLASSTRAKLNEKRRRRGISTDTDTKHAVDQREVQELQRQGKQVLRKVFQLQDEVYTLRRSQSLDRMRQSQSHSHLTLSQSQSIVRQNHDNYSNSVKANNPSVRRAADKDNHNSSRTGSPSNTLRPSSNHQRNGSSDIHDHEDSKHHHSNNTRTSNNINKAAVPRSAADALHLLRGSQLQSSFEGSAENRHDMTEEENAEEAAKHLQEALSRELQSEQDWSQLKSALLSRAAILHHKERDFLAREKILRLKEASLLQREQLTEAEFLESEPRLAQALSAALKEADTLKQQVSAYRQQASEKDATILALKEQLFQHNNNNGDNGSGTMTDTRRAVVSAEERQQSEQRRTLALEALSRLTKALPTNNNSHRNSSRVNAKAAHSNNTDNNTDSTTIDAASQLVVQKADYEALLRDYAVQDNLIAGFQRENERLVSQLHTQLREQQLQQSQFFNQRDQLNKELNQLRHLASEKHPQQQLQQRLSLQGQLNNDAKQRDLQEKVQLLNQELANTRRQAAMIQDSLRQEVLALQSDLKQLDPQHLLHLRKILAEKDSELADMKPRLQRLIAQQEINSDAEATQSKLRMQLMALKQEVLKRGAMSVGAVNKLLKQTENLPLHSLPLELDNNDNEGHNISGIHNTTINNTNNNGSQRSFADIKRIKELEQSVRDLQDALKKRHPDSLSSLIQATKIDDMQSQKEIKRLKEALKDMSHELQRSEEAHERKMQQLQCQHDALRVTYDQQLTSLRNQLKQQQNHANNQSNGNSNGNIVSNSSNKTVKELEMELTRSRSFYTRKIEDLQRKHEAQLRALKRSAMNDDYFEHNVDNNSNKNNSNYGRNHATNSSSKYDNSDTSAFSDHNNHHSGQSNSSHECSQNTSDNSIHNNEAVLLQEKLNLLQSEFFATTEALGLCKAENRKLQQRLQQLELQLQQALLSSNKDNSNNTYDSNNNNSNNSNNNDSKNSNSATEESLSVLVDQRIASVTDTLTQQHQQEVQRLMQQQQIQIAALRASFQKMRDSSVRNNDSNTNYGTNHINSSKENEQQLEKLLQSEKSRCALLTSELLKLRQRLQINEQQNIVNTTNDSSKNHNDTARVMMPAELLEKQLSDLQRRFSQREQELRASVTQTQTQHILERQRLEQTHAMELRLKDEQLLRFRLELQNIVSQLAHYQQQQPNSAHNSNSHSNNNQLLKASLGKPTNNHHNSNSITPRHNGSHRQPSNISNTSNTMNYANDANIGVAELLLHSP